MSYKNNRKIYYVVNARLPTEKAHGVQIAKMCEALIRQGVALELIVPRRSTVSEGMREFYDLDVEIPVRRLPVLDCYEWGPIGFWIGSLSFLCAYTVFFLSRRVVQHAGQRAVIYTTDIDQFSFLLIPFLGLPYIVELHDAKPWSLRFYLFLRRAAGVVVINRIIQREIAATFGIEARGIAVHPNGIDLARFVQANRAAARLARSISPDIPIALYAGKCYPWKGLDALVQAAVSSPEIHFYLVGGTVDELAAATGINAIPVNIMAIGHQPYRVMPEWLAAADVLLLTGTHTNDYSYLHTSPMKLFEYMAAERPIIAADTPAVREVVSQQEVFFYAPDDGRDLAATIAYVLAHPAEAEVKVAAAAALARQFSWQLRADAVIHFMREKISSV